MGNRTVQFNGFKSCKIRRNYLDTGRIIPEISLPDIRVIRIIRDGFLTPLNSPQSLSAE